MATFRPKGIVEISGEKDSGKTLAALTAYPPKETAYLFDDVKEPPIDPKEFGLFVNLVGDYGNLKLLEFQREVLAILDKIPAGKYKSIIFDTWSRFGLALRNYAIKHPSEFREPETFSKLGAAKGGEMWKEANRYEAYVISQLAKKVDFVGLITHVKDLYIAGAKSGLQIPDSGRSFNQICNLRLWLKHNPRSGVPIALVLKRIVKVEITEEGVIPTDVLPRKLTPSSEDRTIWDTIGDYWTNPVGNRTLDEEEKPTPHEVSILDGVLTEDQKEVWKAELEERRRIEEEAKLLEAANYKALRLRVLELADVYEDGLPVPILAGKIFEEVKEDFSTSIQTIAKILGD